MSTILGFFAHPDDEVLLAGGTLARLSSEGHRVVIVTATDGVVGTASAACGRRRLDELAAGAEALGVARVVHLGYADSGHGPILYPDPPDRSRFVRAPVDDAAAALTELLRAERVDLVLTHDARGGYGHRDHIRAYEVAVRASLNAGTSRLLQSTRPRRSATHRVDVRRFTAHKRAALAAHRSQVEGRRRGGAPLRVLLRVPPPLFTLVMGWEWFVEEGAAWGSTTIADVLRPARPVAARGRSNVVVCATGIATGYRGP